MDSAFNFLSIDMQLFCVRSQGQMREAVNELMIGRRAWTAETRAPQSTKRQNGGLHNAFGEGLDFTRNCLNLFSFVLRMAVLRRSHIKLTRSVVFLGISEKNNARNSEKMFRPGTSGLTANVRCCLGEAEIATIFSSALILTFLNGRIR